MKIFTGSALLFLFFIIFIFAFAYFNQEKLIFFPEKLPENFVFGFANRFEEVFLDTKHGEKIHGLHFRVNKPKGIILYFHGNAGSLRSWGGIAENFIPLGYELFIVDYRGYGKSTGSISEKSLLQDGELVYTYLKNKLPEEKIIVYGRSIGTGIAVHLAKIFSPGKLILESPYTNLPDLAKYHYPIIPRFFVRYALSCDQWISEVKCPIYIFHGTYDSIVPFDFGKSLARIKPENTTFIPVEGGDHNDLDMFEEYHTKLSAILK